MADGDGFGDLGVVKIQKFDYGGVEGESAALDELERGDGGVCLADGGYAESGIAAIRDVPGAVGEAAGAEYDVAGVVGNEDDAGEVSALEFGV